MKNSIVIFLIFFIGFASGWSQEPLFLSIQDAEDLAIQNNHQLHASLHRLQQGYYGYKSSKSCFYPTVKASSQIDIGKDQHSLDSALLVTQPLFDRAAFYDLKEAQIEWERLRLDVQQQICDLLFQVREAYHSILLNQAHLAIDQIIVHLWEEEIKRQECRLELGVSIPFELNQARLHLKNAWIDYYATENEVRKSKIKLLTALGLAPGISLSLTQKDIQLPSPDWQTSYCLDKWKEWGECYSPRLKQEQFFYLLSQNRIFQTRARNYPTVSVYASAGHRYIYNGFDHQPYVGAGVSVDWMLYDPSNQQKINEAKEQKEEALSTYHQVKLELEASIYDLIHQIEYSYLTYLAAQEGAKLAEEGMGVAAKKHQLGLLSSFEYRDVMKTFHEARHQVNQARFSIRNLHDQLIQQTGLDLQIK